MSKSLINNSLLGPTPEKYLGLLSLVIEYFVPEITRLRHTTQNRYDKLRTAQVMDLSTMMSESQMLDVLDRLQKVLMPFEDILKYVYYRDKNEREDADSIAPGSSRYALLRPQLICNLLSMVGKWWLENESILRDKGYDGWFSIPNIDPQLRQYDDWRYLTDIKHLQYLPFIQVPFELQPDNWDDVTCHKAFNFRVDPSLCEAEKRQAHCLMTVILHMELSRYTKQSEPWQQLWVAYQEHHREFQKYDLRLRLMFMGRDNYDQMAQSCKAFADKIFSHRSREDKRLSLIKKLTDLFVCASGELEERIVKATRIPEFGEVDLTRLLIADYKAIVGVLMGIEELTRCSTELSSLLPLIITRPPEKKDRAYTPSVLKFFYPFDKEEDFTGLLSELLFAILPSLSPSQGGIFYPLDSMTDPDPSMIISNIEKMISGHKSITFFGYGLVCLMLVERYRHLQRFLMRSHNSQREVEVPCESWLKIAASCFSFAQTHLTDSDAALLIQRKPYSEWVGFFNEYCVAQPTTFFYHVWPNENPDFELALSVDISASQENTFLWDPRVRALVVSRVRAPITADMFEKINDKLEKYVLQGGGVSGEDRVMIDPDRASKYELCKLMRQRIPNLQQAISVIGAMLLQEQCDDPILLELITQLKEILAKYNRNAPLIDLKSHCLVFCQDSLNSWRYRAKRSLIVSNMAMIIFITAIATIASCLIAYFAFPLVFAVNQLITLTLFSSILLNSTVFLGNKFANGHFLFFKPRDIEIHVKAIQLEIERNLDLSLPGRPVVPEVLPSDDRTPRVMLRRRSRSNNQVGERVPRRGSVSTSIPGNNDVKEPELSTRQDSNPDGPHTSPLAPPLKTANHR